MKRKRKGRKVKKTKEQSNRRELGAPVPLDLAITLSFHSRTQEKT
jgi:hypothetical protein